MSELDELQIEWRPIAELEPGRMVLLRAPKNSLGRRETVFYGYRQGGYMPPMYHGIFFDIMQPRTMLIEADAFALIPGM
jgi:hypothetical protein